MSVCDLVNNDRAVVFDSSGAYGVHKKTGMRNESAWRGREWELTVDLEATAKAEEAVKKYIAELQALHSRATDPVDVPGGAENAPVETVGSKRGFSAGSAKGAARAAVTCVSQFQKA